MLHCVVYENKRGDCKSPPEITLARFQQDSKTRISWRTLRLLNELQESLNPPSHLVLRGLEREASCRPDPPCVPRRSEPRGPPEPTLTSSRLKSTPPIGAPKATETPAAAAADSTCEAKSSPSARGLSGKSAGTGEPGEGGRALHPAPAHLAPLALVLAVLGEEAAEEVATAACHVHQRPFLAKAQARGHHQHQGDSLDQQGPLAPVAPDDEAPQDGLYLKHRMENDRE